MTESLREENYILEFSRREALFEVLRQTERHLEEQQRLTGSADQRALAFSAVLIVVIGILLTGDRSELGVASVSAAFLMLISVGTAIYSARPTRVFGSGGTGASLANYLASNAEGYLYATLIDRNDRNIAHNDRVLKQSAFVFRISMSFATLAVGLLFADWIAL